MIDRKPEIMTELLVAQLRNCSSFPGASKRLFSS